VFLTCRSSLTAVRKRAFASSTQCTMVTVRPTTKLGSILHRSGGPRGIVRPSTSAGGAARSALLKKHGIHRLFVIGLIAHTCVESTVRSAAELGYDVTLVKDATADYADEFMHAALVTNLPNYASAIVTADEVVEILSSHLPLPQSLSAD